MFFLDLRTAFASVARALAFPLAGGCSDLLYFQQLTELGLSREEVLDLVGVAQNPTRLNAFYGSPHRAHIVSALVQASWLSSYYIPGVITPTVGTMAVSSLADLLFLVAFSRVVDHFDEQCGVEWLNASHDVPGAHASFGVPGCPSAICNNVVAYMDDVFKPVR